MSIKQKRQSLGLTQEALATAIGVSVNTIQKWERSPTKPSRENQKKLDEFWKLKEENANENANK